MHSISILEQRCPRCANRRTVHVGYSRHLFCFNCRLRWERPTYEPKPQEAVRA
jgi:hypothetical protein